MSVTVNLINNTTLFMKVDGIEEVIVPNSEIEDKTHQWISTENKSIKILIMRSVMDNRFVKET